MAKEEEEKKVKEAWKRPETKADVERLLMKNLDGFCTRGARAKNNGWFPMGHFYADFATRYGTLPLNIDLANYKDFDPKEPGGIPKGRITEIYGEPSGGKSSICLRIIGNAQKAKKTCVWFDREMSFVESLAELNGVDLDTLFMVDKPELSAEECFDKMYAALESGVDLIVIDSVSGLIPKAILDGTDSTKDTMALLARVMGKCIPKLATICAKTGGTVIFINQVRQKPGVTWGNPETTPGGDTLKFYASLRLQIKRQWGEGCETHRVDENGQSVLIASNSYVKIVKNRMSKNLKDGIPVPIYFEAFFPDAEERAFDLGRQVKLISTREGNYTWKFGEKKDERLDGVGRKGFIDALVAANMVVALIEKIKEEAAKEGMLLPPELMSYKTTDKKKIKKKDKEQSEESKAMDTYLQEESDLPQEQMDTETMAIEAKSEADALLGADDSLAVAVAEPVAETKTKKKK